MEPVRVLGTVTPPVREVLAAAGLRAAADGRAVLVLPADRPAELRTRRELGAVAAVFGSLVVDVAAFSGGEVADGTGGLGWVRTTEAAVDRLLDVAAEVAGPGGPVTVVHKGNSIKRTDGLLGRRAADRGAPFRTAIVDDFAARLVRDPEQGVVLTPEVYAPMLLGVLAGATGRPLSGAHRLIGPDVPTWVAGWSLAGGPDLVAATEGLAGRHDDAAAS